MSDNREIADSMMNALGYVKATTPADELRTAATWLRCTHSFPVNPSGPCRCGMTWDRVRTLPPENLREPLAASLEQAAKEYEFFGANSESWASTTAVSLLRVARALNGTTA